MSNPARTTPTLVQGILGGLYGTVNGVLTPLDGYIAAASAVVDRVLALAQVSVGEGLSCSPGRTVPGQVEAELMERWLAAGYYLKMDPAMKSKGQGGANASFQRSDEWENDYIKCAVDMDPSRCLAAILKGRVAYAGWLGKPASEQTPIDQRD